MWPLPSGQRPTQQAPAWARRQAGTRVALSISAAGGGTLYLQKTCKTRTSSTAQSLGTCSRRRRCPRVRAITPPASRQRDGRQRAEHAAGAPREASAPGGTARGSRSPTLPQERCGEAKQPPRTDTSPASTADRSRGWCPVPRATAGEQRPLNSSPVPSAGKLSRGHYTNIYNTRIIH